MPSLPQSDREELVEKDLAHLIHPLYHREDHKDPIIFVRGHGVYLVDIGGKEYLDGLSCLWNVNVGHGRVELAEAAREQMAQMAFCSSYTGFTNVPAIQLAERLTQLAYPRMQRVFFASGGAEANESAFKLARFYWRLRGYPNKTKIISRTYGYHGVTLATLSATGIPAYRQAFGPLCPGFAQIGHPHCYRCPWGKEFPRCDYECAEALEEAILAEGRDTVAAFIAEPVQGAGGVIPPPPDYFPRVRKICDTYGVLFIADEVITGFGRTGRWFALGHWDVEPDMVSFGKGITSGYIPLAGVMASQAISDTLDAAPRAERFMHAFTYSAHPTACSVALRNIQIIEEEDLVARAAEAGARLRQGLEGLKSQRLVGEVRGLGLMAAVELVADRGTRRPFDASAGVGPAVLKEALGQGLAARVIGDTFLLAPPLIIREEETDRIVGILGQALETVASRLSHGSA